MRRTQLVSWTIGIATVLLVSSTGLGQGKQSGGAKGEGKGKRAAAAAKTSRSGARAATAKKDNKSKNDPKEKSGKHAKRAAPTAGKGRDARKGKGPGATKAPHRGPTAAADGKPGAGSEHPPTRGGPSGRGPHPGMGVGRPDVPGAPADPAVRAERKRQHMERLKARRANLDRNPEHKSAITSAKKKQGLFAKEQRKHIRRMARIRRLLRVALDAGETDKAAALRKLQKKEMNRHARKMKLRHDRSGKGRGEKNRGKKEGSK